MHLASAAAVVDINNVTQVNPRLVLRDDARHKSGTRITEHRRSPRVTLRKPLSCFFPGHGRATIQTISLGGASLVSSFRPAPKSNYRIRLAYGDGCVDANVSIYRAVVHELFYSERGSRLRYSIAATFDDPSVPALNLLYRIIGDHWVDSGDDDTTPCER